MFYVQLYQFYAYLLILLDSRLMLFLSMFAHQRMRQIHHQCFEKNFFAFFFFRIKTLPSSSFVLLINIFFLSKHYFICQ